MQNDSVYLALPAAAFSVPQSNKPSDQRVYDLPSTDSQNTSRLLFPLIKMADEVVEDEYKEQARLLKEEGDAAFKSNNIELAIKYFTQSIEIDPDNHITYSNRSAAYMKSDSKSKALYDAEKCVELAPNWPKGYNRLGVAQQSLKRFQAALDSYKKGLELDPNNKPLWEAMKACQEAFEQDKQQRFRSAALERAEEEKRQQRFEEVRKEVLKNKEAEAEEELLSGFLAEVAPPSTSTAAPVAENEDDALASFLEEVAAKPAPDVTVSAEAVEAAKDEKALTEKYANQDLGDGRSQVARILARHYEWRNLNPFHVLDLDSDATDEDIKLRYKKLSLKVHPDRLRDLTNARDAFEQVKEAYMRLMDPDQRRTLCMHIDNVTSDVKRERKKQLARGVKEKDLPTYEEERSRALMKHFADLEQMRRLSEKNRRAYSAREQKQEAEAEAAASHFNEFDKNWQEEDRRDKRVGNWRDFQHDPAAKRPKAMNYKEEQRQEVKHGVVKLEEWKKSWK